MKKFIKIFIAIICIVHFSAMSAQDFSEEVRDQMSKLSYMVGEWEGTGFAMLPDGQKGSSQVNESIRYDLDGTIIKLRGIGLSGGVKVHNALGILYYDMFTESFKMNSWLSKGMSTTANVEVLETGKVKWWFVTSQDRTIRYTIDIQGDEWAEVGEMSVDGENWQVFFEMNLHRVRE